MARSDILRIKDELLETMLDSFRSDDLLRKNLILQGGGALHFIYGSPRHSNDLDFVCEDLKNIQDEVKDRFKKGIEFNGTKIVPELKNLDSSYPDRPFIRAKYSLGQNQPTVSLELLSQKSFDNSATEGKYNPIKVESPTEIYADKIAATLIRMKERGSFKGTDLFDLNYIDTNFNKKASFNDIKDKVLSYNKLHVLNPDVSHRVIQYICDPKNQEEFKRTIKKTLLADVSSHMEMDRKYFEGAANHFMQYLGDL